MSKERAPSSVFSPNPEYSPRIPGCGRVGSTAVAFGGMGIGVAENRVKGERFWGKVLGGKKQGNLTLGSAPEACGGTGKVQLAADLDLRYQHGRIL
ncbi:hypothetical protein PO909_014850 [Leuciscus waleckii]